MIAVDDKLSWFIARSSGWVAAALLALTVMWGVFGVARVVERRGLPRWLADIHRFLALLTVLFTAVHVAALVADNYIHIGWREVLVPFALRWRPGAVAWGVVALYGLTVVQVSSWMRRWMPRRWWRRLHLLSYPVMWMVVVHGLQAGTDAGNLGVRIGVGLLVAANALVIALRIIGVHSPRAVPTTSPDAVDADATDGPTATLDGGTAASSVADAPTLVGRAVSPR